MLAERLAGLQRRVALAHGTAVNTTNPMYVAGPKVTRLTLGGERDLRRVGRGVA